MAALPSLSQPAVSSHLRVLREPFWSSHLDALKQHLANPHLPMWTERYDEVKPAYVRPPKSPGGDETSGVRYNG